MEFFLDVYDVFIYLSGIEKLGIQLAKLSLLAFIFSMALSSTARAQFGFSHEVGGIAGPVSFRSDYGQRNDISTNMGNTGYGIGIVHYLNFSYKADCNCYTPETYFNDHFKLRSELSFSKTSLKHYGEWVDPSRTSLFNDQLRAMRGSTQVTNLGMQLEFFPFSIRDFTNTIGGLAPFVSLGGQFSFYDPAAWSTIGDGEMNTPATTPIKYFNATQNESGSVWSIVSSVGTRYKLAPLSDLMIDLRVQYYFSNWVDGLSPNPSLYPENKANDWLVWLNVGYIYYIE